MRTRITLIACGAVAAVVVAVVAVLPGGGDGVRSSTATVAAVRAPIATRVALDVKKRALVPTMNFR